jgi:hypothetical protein
VSPPSTIDGPPGGLVTERPCPVDPERRSTFDGLLRTDCQDELREGGVDAAHRGLPQVDAAVPAPTEVAHLPRFAPVRDRQVKPRAGLQRRADGEALLERLREDERLQRAARLTAALGREVELAVREVRAAVQRLDRPGRGLDRHDRRRRAGGTRERRVGGRGGELLEPGVERGAHLEATAEQRPEPLVAVRAERLQPRELALDGLDDVGLRAVLCPRRGAAGLHRRRFTQGRLGLRGVDEALLGHCLQDLVAADECAVRLGDQGGRGADEAGEQCGLVDGQLARLRPEVALRSGSDPVRTRPEVDLVEVALEQLVLRVPVLERRSHPELGELAPHPAVRRGRNPHLGNYLGAWIAAGRRSRSRSTTTASSTCTR